MSGPFQQPEPASQGAERDQLLLELQACRLALRTKNEQLIRISHTMRTPLSAILVYAQMLEIQSALAPAQRDCVQEIRLAGASLQSMLDEVLDLAQTGNDARVPSGAPLASAPLRILIAEDHETNQELLLLQLSALGHEAEVAENGATALEKCLLRPYDLVLTDLHMPVMDGLALTRALRQHEASGGRRTPVVAITADVLPAELQRCRDAGMDDVLTKPVALEDLSGVLLRWTRQPPTPVAAVARSQAEPDDTDAILDLEQLYRVLGPAGPGHARHLVATFIRSATEGLDRLAQVPVAERGLAVAREMHKQKSAGRTVGAMRYARHAHALEQRAQAGHTVSLAGLRTALADVEAACACAVVDYRPVSGEVVPPNFPEDEAEPAISAQDIRDGMDRDEFMVWFQPKLDSRSLHPIGVEALARWRAPGGAWVPPVTFIGLAEREGFIGELSQILFAKALTEAAQLHDAGFALTIAVNLSGLWLREPNVPEFIVATTQVAGLHPTDVMLELNEASVMEDPVWVLEVLTRLRLKGFGLSMDKFGLCTPTLQTVAHLPWSELKLHRNFLLGGQQDAAQRALLARGMAMARQLQLGTIAEGVETPGELACAQSLGCDGVQGHFLAKPMPIADTRSWLIAQQVRAKSPG